ncbi:MAG: DEAD/DEAH box helicase [Candidatus Nanopelagicales bacterium]
MALQRFMDRQEFELDDFQLRACESLEQGRGVLVAAPTGAGKTIVGEFAVFLALEAGGKCFYTTPIKALSNQKYREFVHTYGDDRIGLLTGDISINSNADVIVMTTEVLRNMLYAGSETLSGLLHVVMDEVHYLADRDRGAVWEEVILQLPESVTVTALSATVSNAEEFGDWLQTVRGDTDVIVEEHRPVPLWQHVAVQQRLLDLFRDEEQREVNPELMRIGREQARVEKFEDHRRGRPKSTPSRTDVIERLEGAGLLPAITFIFSRAGCDAAVRQCLNAGLRLTTHEERKHIFDYAEQRTSDLPAEDLHVLGYDEWLAALQRGIAAHHAGLIPRFKEIIEDLFQHGYLKAIFATETLALGINMPAKSVVLERLTKWNGDTHADITPGEYTQLTGRAGRRGIDHEGHAIVVWHPGLDPRALAGLASTRTYPLRSSFRPAYTMAVNLVDSIGYTAAREVLESSFAQFQADRAVVGLVRQVRKNEEAMAGYHEAMQCHLGDFEAYAALRREISDLERGAARQRHAQARMDAAESLATLERGDVILVPSRRRGVYAVVVDTGPVTGFDARPSVMTADRMVRRVSSVEFQGRVEVVARVRLPRAFDARKAQSRKQAAELLRDATATIPARRERTAAAPPHDIDELRRRMRAHACHGCADREDHARWGERYFKLRLENRQLEERIEQRTNSIARAFDRVCTVLTELGYLQGELPTPSVTDEGRRLAGLHTELDLLVAEVLARGILDDLTPAEFASVASLLVHESRREVEVGRPPTARAQLAIDALMDVWLDVTAIETAYGANPLREPDPSFAPGVYRWASGAKLSTVLHDSDITAGDFVRWVRRIIDLLEQIMQADERYGEVAHQAIAQIQRGIVASIDVEE